MKFYNDREGIFFMKDDTLCYAHTNTYGFGDTQDAQEATGDKDHLWRIRTLLVTESKSSTEYEQLSLF